MSIVDQLKNELKTETTLFLEHPCSDCWCPRCGEEFLDIEPILNSNSRQVESVLICEKCGIEEGEMFFINKILPLKEWAYFK